MVIGAHLAGASLSITANLALVSRKTVLTLSLRSVTYVTPAFARGNCGMRSERVKGCNSLHESGGFCDGVEGAITSRGLGQLVGLRSTMRDDYYLSILPNPPLLILRTLFPGELPMFQNDYTPVHTSRCVQTCSYVHDDEVEYLT
ncbi:hypothetical protein TNCV_242241 [Trichonephila clavipes]|uniref:Uncharacterized protein n=1 Tax=Trichonephila clavipes TaxID=2585209 RepID=A0A8X6W3T5_TRICX|nr:hypothetical protein TNCV_242241 [Trichonephila clavipes]